MATVYSGSGDPKRSLELLWGQWEERPRRGPKPRFTVDDIVTTAIGLADSEGLPALSMRRVATELGVTAMSLYGYVPSKAELVDVILDRVLGEIEMPEDLSEGWRVKLEHVAWQNWHLGLRHPWLSQVALSRPVLGPNLLAKYDYELRAVAGIGLSPIEMDLVIGVVGDYARGAARAEVEADEAAQRTGLTDDQWWRAYTPLLEAVFDAEKYPTAAWVGTAVDSDYGAASDPAQSFEFGLERLLDGVAVLVQARQAQA